MLTAAQARGTLTRDIIATLDDEDGEEEDHARPDGAMQLYLKAVHARLQREASSKGLLSMINALAGAAQKKIELVAHSVQSTMGVFKVWNSIRRGELLQRYLYMASGLAVRRDAALPCL